jgi:hypothetical protein
MRIMRRDANTTAPSIPEQRDVSPEWTECRTGVNERETSQRLGRSMRKDTHN